MDYKCLAGTDLCRGYENPVIARRSRSNLVMFKRGIATPPAGARNNGGRDKPASYAPTAAFCAVAITWGAWDFGIGDIKMTLTNPIL